MKPINDNVNSALQVSKDNQLILKSNNAAISTVSTTTGQIMDKANENKDLLTKLNKDIEEIGQEIQTLATYGNSSLDNQIVKKKFKLCLLNLTNQQKWRLD